MTIALVIAALIILGSIAVLALCLIYCIDELRKLDEENKKLKEITARIWKRVRPRAVDEWSRRLP